MQQQVGPSFPLPTLIPEVHNSKELILMMLSVAFLMCSLDALDFLDCLFRVVVAPLRPLGNIFRSVL